MKEEEKSAEGRWDEVACIGRERKKRYNKEERKREKKIKNIIPENAPKRNREWNEKKKSHRWK